MMRRSRFQTRLIVALVTALSLVSARSIAPKNHRMGDALPSSSAQQVESTLGDGEQLQTGPVASGPATSSTPEIVVNSIEEPVQANGMRHQYDQQPSQQTQAAQPSGSSELAPSEPKMEARSHLDNSLEQAQQQEQLIIDHRPNDGAGEQLFVSEYNVSNGPPANTRQQQQPTPQPSAIYQTSSTPSSAAIQSTTTPATSSTTTVTTSTSSAPSSAPSSSSTGGGQMMPNWFATASSSNQPQFYIASNQMQAQQQQQQTQANGQSSQLGSMMPASSNQIVSMQHPTSINSIISEQQQQNGAVPPGNTAQVLATINGQPTSLIFLGQTPTQAAASSVTASLGSPLGQQTQQQPLGIGLNGRRVAISNWLRGIGNLLANIFNRREHGLNQAGLVASSSNGYAFLAPVSSSVNSPLHSQSGGGSGGGGGSSSGNWIHLGPNAPHWLTQAQSAMQQLGASSSRLAASLIQGPSQQLQQQSAGINNYQQVQGDLQMSGSSPSLVSVQAPSGVPMNNGAQAYQTGTAIVLIPPAAQAQQQAQQQVTKQQQLSSVGQAQARSFQARQTSGQQTSDSNPQTNSSSFSRSQQPVTSTIIASGSKQISRFHRSASGSPNSSSTSRPRSSGNLPLAHYSQYSD